MNTIERNAIIRTGPWILYDGMCGLCTGGVARLGPVVTRRGFRLTPLQGPIGQAFDTGIDEMQVITRGGKVVGGVEAYAYIARHIWWAWPFVVLWYLPVCRQVLKWAYRLLAANRYRLSSKCELKLAQEENPYAIEL